MLSNHKSMVFLQASALYFSLLAAAHADELVKSWRLQGPAFSHHFSTDLAPMRGDEVKNEGLNRSARNYQDYQYKDGENTSDYCTRFGSILAGVGPSSIDIAKQVRSVCLQDLQEPYTQGGHRRWNEKNTELGAEYDVRNVTNKTVQRYYFGAVIDSYFKPGLYMGGSYQATVYEGSRFRLDAGATGLLWWRTVAGTNQLPIPPSKPTLFPVASLEARGQRVETLHRRLVPAVLPIVSVEDKKLGVGANISFVPKIQWKGIAYSVNTVVLQLTWAL